MTMILTREDVEAAPVERAAVYKVATDMLHKGMDSGLIEHYMREEARRFPAAFVTDWTRFVECPCGSLTDAPTWLGCCTVEHDELELMWAAWERTLRAAVEPPTVVRYTGFGLGHAYRRDVTLGGAA